MSAKLARRPLPGAEPDPDWGSRSRHGVGGLEWHRPRTQEICGHGMVAQKQRLLGAVRMSR